MNISEKGKDFIKRWERLKLKAYRPLPNDRWTIGWGHTQTAYEGLEITVEEARDLLASDLYRYEKCVSEVVRVNLNQEQFDALVSFAYNAGCTGFNTSTLLRELNKGRYNRVPDQLKRWVHDDGKVIQGLVNRRNAEISAWMNSSANISVSASARPSLPKEKSVLKLAKTSKTIKASAGLGSLGVMSIVDDVSKSADKYSDITDIVSNTFDSPTMLMAAGAVGIVIYLIYNRKRDSDTGKAY